MAETTPQPIKISDLTDVSQSMSLPPGTPIEGMNAQLLMNCLKEAVAIDPVLFFAEEIDVNWRDVETGLTLLNLAAGYGDRELLRLLLQHPETDYLVEDREGRFPSTLAFVVAKDSVVGRLLVKKQGDQARSLDLVAYGPDAGATRLDLDD